MNKEDISQLIYFLYNSIKENNNANMSRAEEELMNLCSSEQDTYLLVGDLLADLIFDPTIENDLQMLSVIILFRCNILRCDTIITQYVDQLRQTEALNENLSLLKQLSLTLGSVIGPPHIELLLNSNPNYSILFILYYYVQEKNQNEEEIENTNEILEYIINNSLFDPSKTNIEISTISSGIITYLKTIDDSYDELILSFFSQLPVTSDYLPILFEIVGSFNKTKSSNEKLQICYEKLSEFAKLDEYPFGVKNILDHNISVEFITNYLLMYLYYYFNNEEEDDFEEEEEKKFRIEKVDLFQLSVRFCTIQDYVKERWINDIDSFLIEIQEDLEIDPFNGFDLESGFFIDFYQNPIRCHTLQIIQCTFNLTEFCNGMIELIQQNESNQPLATKLEEVYYYILFAFMTDLSLKSDFYVLPPICNDDVLLYGEYIRCITTIGQLLSEEEYMQILQPESHFIPKIMLAQGIYSNEEDGKFPNKLILSCIECLIQTLDLFQTDCDTDLFVIIGKLVLKSQIEMNDYSQIILLLKNQWIKHINNINRINSINSIIFDFLNSSESVLIIFDTFIPILLESFSVDDLKIQSLLLFKSMTKKLPFKNENQIQISESAMNAITSNIFNDFISIISNIFSNESNEDFVYELMFSIAAFYCRIEIIHPSFLQLIIFAIEKSNDNYINDLECEKAFISFVYEYLLFQTDENIGKIEIVQKIIEFLSNENSNDDNKISKDNLLVLILALVYTQNQDCATSLFTSVDNFFEIVFPFILNNFYNFQSEERFIYATMYLLCIRVFPHLDNQEMDNQIGEIFDISDYENDKSCFLDRDYPFVINHHILCMPKETFFEYFQELIGQLSN